MKKKIIKLGNENFYHKLKIKLSIFLDIQLVLNVEKKTFSFFLAVGSLFIVLPTLLFFRSNKF